MASSVDYSILADDVVGDYKVYRIEEWKSEAGPYNAMVYIASFPVLALAVQFLDVWRGRAYGTGD